ncbi:MAG TPA: hypothetical protein VMW08_04440, partial [Acidimicrobiales bacterium]|nr:hypothetical protein [Acidimicrobiales bacterium]
MLLHTPEVFHLGTSLRSTARLTGTTVDESMRLEASIDRQLNGSVEPFVPPAVVIATVHGEAELVIEGDVSEVLLAGARAAAEYFAMHLGRRPVELVASTRPPAPVVTSLQQTGIFFSRGIDSTSNLILADRGQIDPRPDLAIVIEGIEPANSSEVEAAVNAKTVEVARDFGLDTVVVSTNLRLVMDCHIEWINAFGSVLAGVGLFLAPGLSDAIISSAEGSQQRFSGSHPQIDPLWSDGNLRFHHLPVDVERSERVRLVVEDARAMEFLRVCVRGGPENCGRCDKCLQTAVLISAFGG